MQASELISAIEEAEGKVEGVFGRFAADQLERQVHEEPGGWNGRQILAHLTANRERMQQFMDGSADFDRLYGPGFEEWNRRWVVEREHLSPAALLDEFRRQNALIGGDILALSESELARVVPSRRGGVTLGEMFQAVCASHCLRHAGRVEEVLGTASAET